MEDIRALEEFCANSGIATRRDVMMKEYTTFQIGGAAALMLFPESAEQIALALRFCAARGLDPLVVGNGSNLLVSDQGVSRPVLQLGHRMARVWLEGEDTVWCEAGASLARLCDFAQQNSLTGLEFAYGIPGSVGGAVFMNAGAYGGEMKDVVAEVRFVTRAGEQAAIPAAECAFRYRHSAFTDNGGCVCAARFSLARGDAGAIRARMEELMQRRRDKQPLEYASAGSTFKRPEGNYASALIDQSGLKGLRVGGAAVSDKHAGFVINTGGASCAEVRELIRQVQAAVERMTGYRLEREVLLVGDGLPAEESPEAGGALPIA